MTDTAKLWPLDSLCGNSMCELRKSCARYVPGESNIHAPYRSEYEIDCEKFVKPRDCTHAVSAQCGDKFCRECGVAL
jgi:hypothetical protein